MTIRKHRFFFQLFQLFQPGAIYPILDAHALKRRHITPDLFTTYLQSPPPSSVSIFHHVHHVQLRCKEMSRDAEEQFMRRWMTALRRDAPHLQIILNDRADLVSSLEADGVHVGQQDISVADCRKIIGPNRKIGLSTHTLEEVHAAASSGADYIGFGPVFPTTTKKNPEPVQGLDNLAKACQESSLPVVAIGGIGIRQIPSVVEAGASAIALVSGWLRALDPADPTNPVDQAP